MKQIRKLAGVLLLVLAIIACNGTIVQSVEVTRVVPQTVVVTEPVQKSGFTSGTPVDVSTLPPLKEVPGGGEFIPCSGEGNEPSINWGYAFFPSRRICLNHFPTAPDSPGFTVTLTDPTGHSFQESFTYSQSDILDSKGNQVGSVQQGDEESEGLEPAAPGVNVGIYTPASFPCGNWSVSAQTQDGKVSAGPTSLNVDCSYPVTSALSNLSIDPFESGSTKGSGFANNETIYIVGAAYPPNTAVMVALYQDDPAAGKVDNRYPLGTAKYAVSIMTDNAGNFQAPFVVSSATLRGEYWVVAATTITSDMALPHFGTRFSIK